MNNELRSFIKESLERGQSKDSIREVLAQAGWQDDEVRNGLSAFADVDYPLAVPRPTPYVHAREAFLYLISFIALYVSASSFGYLVFGLIDHAFPDSLDFRDRFPSGGEATSIASVIVAFPLYLFLMKRLSTEVAEDSDKRLSLVRRWLTYLTLVIGAGIILGDVIALLANLLLGDPTLRFFLKGGVILLITTCIFGFYMWDMKRTETSVAGANGKSALRALLGAVVVVVVAALGYSMFLLGTPGEQRDLRLDRERVSTLNNIARNINIYWSLNGTLPGSFEDMSGSRFSISSVNDPESNDRYGYNALGDADYELCAVFSTDADKSGEAVRAFSDRAWDHGIGRTWFQLKAEAVDPGPKPPSTITTLSPTQEPIPPPIYWDVVSSENLSVTTSSATISVHDIVASPNHITVVYSIDLHDAEVADREATVSHMSTLVGSNGAVHKALRVQRLATFQGSTLAAITFEPYKLGSRELYLQIPELMISDPSSSQTSQIDEPIELHILIRLIPHDSSSAITRLPGLETSISGAITGGLPGSFVGSSPRGQVATVGYRVVGVEKWFLVEGDGHVEELSKQSGADILGYLGITAPTPIGTRDLPRPSAQDRQMLTHAGLPSPAPTPTPMPMPTVERDRAEEPPQGPGVEIGAGYPYTLYVHCGVRDARFDGRLWMADPMLSDGSGNPPSGWTADDSRGIMALVRDDLAIFTARSGRTVEFIPWPLDVEWRPCA